MRQEHAKGKLGENKPAHKTHTATAVSDQGLHIYAVKHKPKPNGRPQQGTEEHFSKRDQSLAKKTLCGHEQLC